MSTENPPAEGVGHLHSQSSRSVGVGQLRTAASMVNDVGAVMAGNLRGNLLRQDTFEVDGQRWRSSDSYAKTLAKDDRSHHEAMQAFALVSTLTLGFSVSALVAVACELNAMIRTSGTLIGFCILTAASTCLSGGATVFFTLEIYYVNRLEDTQSGKAASIMVDLFLARVSPLRGLARRCAVWSLSIEMGALGLLLWHFLPTKWAIALVSLLSCGALVVQLIAILMSREMRNVLRVGHERQLEEHENLEARGEEGSRPPPPGPVLRGSDGETVSVAYVKRLYSRSARKLSLRRRRSSQPATVDRDLARVESERSVVPAGVVRPPPRRLHAATPASNRVSPGACSVEGNDSLHAEPIEK